MSDFLLFVNWKGWLDVTMNGTSITLTDEQFTIDQYNLSLK